MTNFSFTSARAIFLTAAVALTAAFPSVGKTFREQQQEFPRVRDAFTKRAAAAKTLFRKHGLPFPPHEILLRVFKKEKLTELWARGDSNGAFRKVKEYPHCVSSGTLGPKRAEGDKQIPEGFYRVTRFNPQSQYHLSLEIDYPNDSDRVLGKKDALGKEIFFHGGCESVGCVALTDAGIEELYVIAAETFSANPTPPAAHFFPGRLDEAGWKALQAEFASQPALLDFWGNLKDGFDFFEEHRKPPFVLIGKTGKYRFIP